MSDALIGSEGSATDAQEPQVAQSSSVEPTKQEPVEQPKWLQNVPKTLLREEMAKYKSVWDYMQDVWKQADQYKQEVEKYSGYVKPLGPDATEEEVKQYLKAMNIPLSAEEYELDIEDKEVADGVRSIASKLYLTKSQAKLLAEAVRQDAEREQKEEEEQRRKELQNATEKVKQAFPNDWAERIKKTNTVLRDLFGQEGMKFIGESGLGNKEWFVLGSIKIAEALSEGKLTPNSTDGSLQGGIDLDEMYPSMKNIRRRR